MNWQKPVGLLAFDIWDIGRYANPNRIWLSVGILVFFNRYNVSSMGSRVNIPQTYIQVYKALEEGMCFFFFFFDSKDQLLLFYLTVCSHHVSQREYGYSLDTDSEHYPCCGGV